MHPAEAAGQRAGRATAVADRGEGRYLRGFQLLRLADNAARDWLEGAGAFVSDDPESRAAYIVFFVAAYAEERRR